MTTIQIHKGQNLKKLDRGLKLKGKYQRGDQAKQHSSCSTLFQPTQVYLSNVQFCIEHLPAIVRKFKYAYPFRPKTFQVIIERQTFFFLTKIIYMVTYFSSHSLPMQSDLIISPAQENNCFPGRVILFHDDLKFGKKRSGLVLISAVVSQSL